MSFYVCRTHMSDTEDFLRIRVHWVSPRVKFVLEYRYTFTYLDILYSSESVLVSVLIHHSYPKYGVGRVIKT